MREYDDEEELMGYVWRNYPEIVRPHECVGPAERVRDELPAELRDEYWEHAAECRRIIEECRASDARESVNGRRVLSKPGLPGMRAELRAAVSRVRGELERRAFWEAFGPHKDRVLIHRCSRCGRILVNEKSRQCLWCGHDWH
jgi:hypothetical protein